MNKITVEYCTYSKTIRQMPQNYLIAYKSNEGHTASWIVDPDPACDPDIAYKAFDLCFKYHSVKWGSGIAFANLLNSKIICVIKNKNIN